MNDTILVAIMAAGRSSRFGSDKLVANIGGTTLGECALRLARATGHPLIWIGSGNGWEPSNCEVVQNPAADQGMGTSVALAAKIATERQASALMILLADMPLVSTELLQAMLRQGAPVCCRYPDGNPGPPALFPAGNFTVLTQLNGDVGARQILATLPGMKCIEPIASELIDIDEPGDLATFGSGDVVHRCDAPTLSSGRD
jgi:molybdenum cofactor cytidylyltransferase